ncbi:MAG: hypothetical protein HY738_09795 [Bacteroidia bacterium]|nr:hypothetical protein [Bacteroidia bacterium]
MSKIKLFILTGKESCDIFQSNQKDRFDEIKDQIILSEFQSEIDKTDFIQNIDDKLDNLEDNYDGYYLILTEDQVSYIMDFAPSNKENF